MRAQKRKDTAPELAIRRELHRLGCGYRVDYPIPVSRRRADIAFPRCRIAVFVDGCFWHACPLHGTVPKHNRTWWEDKLRTNVARDRDTDQRLHEAGWTVIRVWEHEDPVAAARAIAEIYGDLRARQATPSPQ
ncbi:very short patch repair endonuclease [Marichromatium gracile]|uniref:Very short patch repair endonuclease n=1 Tax=Marichromatium gracile TaxID=1048 RepID=A0ABR5VL42_MARGR|nr:very short patch repair endonuclease [Marichromatium gracile]KXX66401.1 very short patch repair endonuclease [Marichromatium gracile]